MAHYFPSFQTRSSQVVSGALSTSGCSLTSNFEKDILHYARMGIEARVLELHFFTTLLLFAMACTFSDIDVFPSEMITRSLV